jgi:lysophospholipid acyltransferase (LPLAT)-like uncharacterized protein
MKLHHPIAIKSAAFTISLLLRAWMPTIRVNERFADTSVDPRTSDRPTLYLFWHENLFLPAYSYAPLKIPVLISNHRDGELVAQVVRFMGGEAIRGSSTRGGSRALREMLQTLRRKHLAMTPDGPRGPRRVLQPGAVFLASHAQIDVVPVGIHTPGAWRLKSWDRMAVPKAFHRAQVVVGAPIHVPPDLDRDGLEHYRQLCQRGMDDAQKAAENGTSQGTSASA